MKKIFIKHNGCLNMSFDFNIAKSGLEKAGYNTVNNPTEADEIIFAGCGVRAAWVDDAISQINTYIDSRENQKVVVTGCISKIETQRISDNLKTSNVSFKSFEELVKEYTRYSFELLEQDFSQNEETDLEGDNPLRKKVTPLKEKALAFLDQLDRKYNLSLATEYRKTTKGFFFYNEVEPTEMITVSRSCLYNCSFCTIPKGRGDYRSVQIDLIREKVLKAISKGIFRITLIGDEVGNYGKDLKDGSSLKVLIDKVLELDKRLKIAIRYIEPTPFYKYFETVKKYCLEDRIYLLHIPIQTGSQRLLKEMNRNHNLEKVKPLYEYLTKNTNTVFYCNWMIGFPGETDEDFQQTISLAKNLEIHLNTVIPFSARPETKAFDRIDKVSTEIIEERSELLEQVLFDIKLNRFKKLTGSILVDEQNQMIKIITKAEKSNLKMLKS
jgi:tRNA-2-methylthio-N6-dimethylallyladenosine synthase